MAANKTSEATNARVLTKKAVGLVILDALNKVSRNVCGVGREYRLVCPEGVTPEQLAGALGGVLVGSASGPIVRGAATRIAIIRISTGLLTSSIAAQAALPAGFAIEAVANAGVQAVSISKVSLPTVIANTAKAEQAVVDLLPIVKQTVPVVGESAVKLTRFSVVFNVALAVFDVLRILEQELSNTKLDEREEQQRRGCCDVVQRSAQAAWKKADKILHKHSFKTREKARRTYAIKASRRN